MADGLCEKAVVVFATESLSDVFGVEQRRRRMEVKLVKGNEITFDLQTIREIEILRQGDGNVSVRVHCNGLSTTHDFLFGGMKYALEFYESLWQASTSSKEQMVKVGDMS